MNFFTLVFTQPIYNLLVWLYDVLPGADLGIAIIVTTILVKGLLFPLTFKSLKSQKELQEIQPKIAEIREKYKDNKEEQAKQLMAVYKDHNVNPFASCLPLLIQLPIFFALFRILNTGFTEVNTGLLYPFVANPGAVHETFLGIINLSAISIPLAVLTAIAQFFQMRQTIQRQPPQSVRKTSGAMDENIAASMNRTMQYMLPAFSLVLGVTTIPAGVMLYWLVTTLLTIGLYAYFIGRKKEDAKALIA